MIVKLTKDELDYAKNIGLSRNSINRGAGQSDGCVMDSKKIDILGAQAEYAASKALGLPWDGALFEHDSWQIWRSKGHDIGPLEIRSTTHPRGRLILHDSDKDLSPYVLVRQLSDSEFKLVGWTFARSGKNKDYWHDVGYGRPCYYVPNNKLRPMKELIDNLINLKE